MKAFLLAAGLGSRLRPLTDTTPKCLLTIGGTTLLDLWLFALAEAGVDEVLVNTHHLADQVKAHVAERSDPLPVYVVEEDELLGSAGTLRKNRDFVDGEEMFLAVNADNLTDFDLADLINSHRDAGSDATLTLFRTPRAKDCGIVEVVDGRVVGYVEKPAEPVGNLANAGIYAFHPRVIDELVGPTPLDIGYHLLPGLVGRAAAVELTGYFEDIGTPAALQHARETWKGRPAN